MERSRSEAMRTEVEYTYRSALYSTENMSNQIENLNNEITIMKKQNEKQKKCIDVMMQTNERLSYDLEHYKKLSLHGGNKKGNNAG